VVVPVQAHVSEKDCSYFSDSDSETYEEKRLEPQKMFSWQSLADIAIEDTYIEPRSLLKISPILCALNAKFQSLYLH